MSSKTAETPVMRQLREAKERYPGAVVLTRIGDFYEAMGEDAPVVAQVCGITLTTRNNGSASAVPLAGFPIRAKDEHIRKLVSAGHRVAILEQVEDPALAKGIVKREVTDVITPGVVLEESFLSERRNNFLASVFNVGGKSAFVVADASTGEVILCDAPRDRLDPLIERFEPSEILVSEDDEVPANAQFLPVTHQPAWCFDLMLGRGEIERTYKLATIDGLGFEEHSDEHLICAFGALLRYLREVRPSGFGTLRRPRFDRGGEVMHLDRMTTQNLELVQPLRTTTGAERGTLISVLDHTKTPMGARTLRRWILEPLIDRPAIDARLEVVDSLRGNSSARKTLRTELSGVRDIERIASRLSSGRAGARELRTLADSLAPLPALQNAAAALPEGPYRAMSDAMDLLADVYDLIERAICERPATSPADGDVIRTGYSAELDELRTVRDNAQELIAGIQQRERDATGIPTLKIGHNRVHGYYLEVGRQYADRIPESYQRKQTLANAERYVSPELKSLEEKILTAADRIEVLQAEILRDVREQVATSVSRIIETASVVAVIDVLVSLAEAADRNGYVRPHIHNGYEIEIAAGRHPVVEQMMARESFIPNDVRLSEDRRVLLLTGPNMGGKSTLLRQVGLIQIMAQMGSCVPAQSARLPICDRVFTRVGASDDLVSGKSTFMVEMSELSAIVHGATEHSLLLVDELGRGTSTYDGVSLAWAVTEHLHNVTRAKTIFATHFHELTDLAGRLDALANVSMAVHENGRDIVFLHSLREGPADRSYGLEVGRMAGLPESLLARARDILADLEQNSRSSQVSQMSDPAQGDLFASPAAPTGPDPRVAERLDGVDVNRITPLEAMQILADVIDLVRKV